MPRRTPSPLGESGLDALRRSGAVTELLFLYECQTGAVARLAAVADRLGLTVQAVSHLYRELARRGWVEVRNRQYVLTVAGVAALHGTLAALAEEIARRLDRLQIVRTTTAVARRPIDRGEAVTLALVDGVLTAVPGRGNGSRGRARSSARAGGLVEVGELEGVVPITPGRVAVLVVPRTVPPTGAVRRRAAAAVRQHRPGLIVAQGLEALRLARTTTSEPVGRFGAPFGCLEASRLGVDSVAFVTEEELPRFVVPFAGPAPPPITVVRLA